MRTGRNNRLLNLTIAIFGIVPLIFWVMKYINYDMWFDEVFSLQYYVLVPWDQTTLNYPYPNNHIFLNLINQLVTRTWALRDINELADNVHVLRGIQLLFVAATGMGSYKVVRDFFSKQYAVLVIPILFSTVPFMNFSLQLRGYNLSAMLVVALVYQTWSYLKFGSKKFLVLMAGTTCVLLYTIPSNAYMVLAIGISLIPMGFTDRFKIRPRAIYALISGLFGIAIAGILYSPIMNDVLGNEYVTEKAPNTFYAFQTGFELLKGFLSGRYLIGISALLGIGILMITGMRKDKKKLTSLLIILIVPFILAFIHQRFPFQRVFVVLAPVFAIAITVATVTLLELFHGRKTRIIACIILVVSCVGRFFYEVENNSIAVEKQLSENVILVQTAYQNYYLGNFFEQKEAMELLSIEAKSDTVYRFKHYDSPSCELYLNKQQVNHLRFSTQPEIVARSKPSPEFYVVTCVPEEVIHFMKEANIETRLMTQKPSYTNVIHCKRLTR